MIKWQNIDLGGEKRIHQFEALDEVLVGELLLLKTSYGWEAVLSSWDE